MNQSTRFLVVDDFEMTRIMLKNSLVALGYTRIDEAVDGIEAKDLLEKAHTEKNPYAAVLSDLNMPRLDGMGLLKFCRSDARFKTVVFVMITAESDRNQVVTVLKNGANDYIPKPFSQATLEKKILRLCEHFDKAAA